MLRYCSKEQTLDLSYNDRGNLTSYGSNNYVFNKTGTTLTKGLNWHAEHEGLDHLDRIVSFSSEGKKLSLTYNAMGEVTSHGEKNLSWDVWGRLVRVEDHSTLWQASYDPFDRRIQTSSQSQGTTTVIRSYYDPEDEFQEIGIHTNGKTFWKIIGPNTCDAMTDEEGSFLFLVHNALRQLNAVVTPEDVIYTHPIADPYGFTMEYKQPQDLLSYAESLSWHSKSIDNSGFVWMGDRHYDPMLGCFLSEDPVCYPLSLDLYS